MSACLCSKAQHQPQRLSASSTWIKHRTVSAGATRKFAASQTDGACAPRSRRARSLTLAGIAIPDANFHCTNLRSTARTLAGTGVGVVDAVAPLPVALPKCADSLSAPCSVGPCVLLRSCGLAANPRVVVEPAFKNKPRLVRSRASHQTRQNVQSRCGLRTSLEDNKGNVTTVRAEDVHTIHHTSNNAAPRVPCEREPIVRREVVRLRNTVEDRRPSRMLPL